jgi:hypothetical protein
LPFSSAVTAVGQPQRGKNANSPATDVPAHFVDITQKSGVSFHYLSSHTSEKYLIETMGAGVALFDYDNDGRLDIFLVNGAPLDDPTPKGTIPKKARMHRYTPIEIKRELTR